MRSSNPALSKNVFQTQSVGEHMTMDGVVNRTSILLIILAGVAIYTWNVLATSPYIGGLLIGSIILALIVGFITIFKKEWAPITAPIYAGVEGLVLGAISVFMEAIYPGIVMQAVLLTFGVLLGMLFIYRTRIIKVTENFRMGVAAAMFAVFLIYMASFVLSFFGIRIPLIHEGGIIGIGFSVLVIIIASLNLILDFDFIEKGVENRAPKYLEWYAGFGLMVTLIWLYIEFLRLLSKMKN